MALLAHRVQGLSGLARQLRFSSAAATAQVVDEMVSYARSNFKVRSATRLAPGVGAAGHSAQSDADTTTLHSSFPPATAEQP